MKKKLSKQEKLILFYVAVFSVVLIVVTILWKNDTYYSNAYSPVVERARQNREIEAENRDREQRGNNLFPENSAQPSAAGLKEREIQKKEGNGYRTF